MRKTNRILTGVSMLALMSAVQSNGIPTSALAKATDPAEIMNQMSGVYGPPPISDEEAHRQELEAQLEILFGLGACAASIAAVTIAANVPKMSRKSDGNIPIDENTTEETSADIRQPDKEIETDIDSPTEEISPRQP